MTVGNLFGEDDIIYERPRMCTVVCNTNEGILYCLKLNEFMRKFKPNDETWYAILKGIEYKNHIFKERLKRSN